MITKLPERIQRKIVIDQTGCWQWKGWVGLDGYGDVWWKGKIRSVHRVVYSLLKAAPPKGLVSDHLCRNRACANPDHIEMVTNRENILRGNGCSSKYAGVTHCKQGHPFDKQNTIQRKDGSGRDCKICARSRSLRHWHRKGKLVRQQRRLKK